MRENCSRKNRNDSSGHYHLPATHMHTTQPVWPTLSAQTKITPKCFGPQEMFTPNNFDHPTFLTPQRFVTLTNVPQKCSTLQSQFGTYGARTSLGPIVHAWRDQCLMHQLRNCHSYVILVSVCVAREWGSTCPRFGRISLYVTGPGWMETSFSDSSTRQLGWGHMPTLGLFLFHRMLQSQRVVGVFRMLQMLYLPGSTLVSFKKTYFKL